MEPRDRQEPSSPRPIDKLLKFRVPEVRDVEVYLVRLPDGTIIARTADELEREAGGRSGG